MLQNRVDPLGNIIRTSARGTWMGNRGILHDEHQHVHLAFKLKAWLICRLEFKGRKRQVMAPHRYTELFFLDEATAFSAGHRPCFECRREDSMRFKDAWIQGNPTYGFGEKTSIQAIDDVLHEERIGRHRKKLTHQEDIASLPDGAFIMIDELPYLVKGQVLYPWSALAYGEGVERPAEGMVTVLTPASSINAFRAGYQPQIGLVGTMG